MINNRATSAYQICLLDADNCSSFDPIDIIIIAPVYTINITSKPIRIIFTVVRIRKPTLCISSLASLACVISRDTFFSSVVHGIITDSAKAASIQKLKSRPMRIMQDKSIFFIIL